jgi:ribonuclease J
MLSHIELAVKLGHIRIPADTVVAVKDIVNMPDNKVVVLCTGGQGETNSALQRMSTGQHPQFKLKFGDTVVQSSTPIPGNEVSYDKLADDLTNLGVKIFSAKFFEVDGCGPLHVSGHAKRDEHRELIDLLKPKYLIPMYAGPRNRKYLAELGMDSGIRGSNILMLDDGEAIEFDNEATLRKVGQARVGTVLIDETGMMVPGLVVKDRLVMQQDGIVMIMLTLNRRGGRLLTSPDIITRGFIYIKQNEDLMQGLRNGLRELARLRFGKGSIDDFKQEIKDFTTHFLYEHTQRSPIVIPVLNVLGGGNGNGDNKNRAGNNNTNAGEKMPQIKPKAEHDINHN